MNIHLELVEAIKETLVISQQPYHFNIFLKDLKLLLLPFRFLLYTHGKWIMISLY
jgi:hypothetical protein